MNDAESLPSCIVNINNGCLSPQTVKNSYKNNNAGNSNLSVIFFVWIHFTNHHDPNNIRRINHQQRHVNSFGTCLIVIEFVHFEKHYEVHNEKRNNLYYNKFFKFMSCLLCIFLFSTLSCKLNS
jgi:hypothetical protein